MGEFLVGIFIGFLAAAMTISSIGHKDYISLQTRAIEVNIARYNPTTSNFEWLDSTFKYVYTGEKK